MTDENNDSEDYPLVLEGVEVHVRSNNRISLPMGDIKEGDVLKIYAQLVYRPERYFRPIRSKSDDE